MKWQCLLGAALCSAIILMVGCQTADPSDGSRQSSEQVKAVPRPYADLQLEGVKWALADSVKGSVVDIQFNDGTVSGHGGVNRYFAGYTLNGSSLRIRNAGSTLMAGPPELVVQERSFLASLNAVKSYRIVGEELRLLNEDGAVEVVLIPALDPELAPNQWSVVAVNNGKGGVVSLLAGTEASVRFDDKGFVSGNSGCNNFQGAYEISGDVLRIGPLAGTRKMCAAPEGIMEQEADMLQALENGSAFSIDGNTLSIRDSKGALQLKLVRDTP